MSSFIALNDTHCPALDGENFVLNTTDHTMGVVVAVDCEDGYSLMGNPVISCQWSGWTGSPYCQEDQSTNMSPLVIVVTTLATIIALVILIVSIYMLIKNCSFEKMKKTSAKAYEEKMRSISDCFGVSQDCVGLPAVTADNWDDKIRGRSLSLRSAESSKPEKKEVGKNLAEHFEPDPDADGKKEFLYWSKCFILANVTVHAGSWCIYPFNNVYIPVI